MYGEGGKRFETLVEEGDEYQHEELIGETIVEVVEPCVLKTCNWCVNAGIVSVKEGQSSNTVTQHGANEVMFFKGIRREHKPIFVMKMIRTKLYLEDNQIKERVLNISNYTKNEARNEENYAEMLARCE